MWQKKSKTKANPNKEMPLNPNKCPTNRQHKVTVPPKKKIMRDPHKDTCKTLSAIS